MQPNNDQNPEQPQPIQSPPQNQQPASGSSMSRTLQPLSSEDSIRTEAQAAQPQPQAQYNATENTSDASPESSNLGNDYTSNLATEPIHRQPQSSTPSLQPASSDSPRSKSGSNKIIPVLIGLVVIAALGVGGYFFLNSKIAAAGLVEAKAQRTTYLRPEDWQLASLSLGIESYASTSDGSSQPMAVVTVDERGSIQFGGGEKPKDYYGEIRSRSLSSESVKAIRQSFNNEGKDCTSEVTFSAEPDTKTANKTVGMSVAIGTCTREDGVYTVKRRTVIGQDDGVFRQITVAASERDWQAKNATFQAMLDSIGQADTE